MMTNSKLRKILDGLKLICNVNNYGIMVLNTPINIITEPQVLGDLWNDSKVRITVDGGTVRWLKWVEKHRSELESLKYQDIISGDMDSLPKEVLDSVTSKNSQVKIVVTEDQDETDFFKALKELWTYCVANNIKIDTVFVLVDSCGRMDQIMANINTLFRSHEISADFKVFLLASDSLTWLLHKGEHVIQIPSCLKENEDWCSLLPIGSPCTVTTKGLKWNLNKGVLSFGGLVSSSNTYDGSPSVTIETDKPLIWSMGIDSLLHNVS